MKVALINPISKTVNELCTGHEIRAWGRKSGNVIVDVPVGFPVKSISDVKSFGPDVVVVEKRGNGVFREFAKNFEKVVDVDGLRLMLSAKPVKVKAAAPVVVKKEPEPVPEPVVVKKEPEPEPVAVPEVVEVAAAAVAEVEEVIQETPKPKKSSSSRKKKTPTKSST
jgi:hypothetical protein